MELNTGETALVPAENRQDVLRSAVPIYRDNVIPDLSLKDNADIRIVDIAKSLDSRYGMDKPETGQTAPSGQCFSLYFIFSALPGAERTAAAAPGEHPDYSSR